MPPTAIASAKTADSMSPAASAVDNLQKPTHPKTYAINLELQDAYA
ncbi:hypothetical protein CO2235_100113 [Cupriavidus oxalaticus]|uniref:Uncharacterized protein n=1 Tax=Cupriavidus oxalaticus TaxID=96344 RepID=A0A375FUT1_9BURK|nr:hypothetical protein CO2235_100113 [Cupriavidus oxalaticus]